MQFIHNVNCDKKTKRFKKMILLSITLTFRRFCVGGNITFLMTFKVFDLLPLMNNMDKLQFFKYPQHVDNSVKKMASHGQHNYQNKYLTHQHMCRIFSFNHSRLNVVTSAEK